MYGKNLDRTHIRVGCHLFRMAFLDDQAWLLSFIRNQFIVSDDTSMCETILGSDYSVEDSTDAGYSSFFGNPQREEDELFPSRTRDASSPDIVMNMDTRMTRRRSNTTVRLEKIRKEREEKGRIKTTHWKTNARNLRGYLSQSEPVLNEIFPENSAQLVEASKPRSRLSMDLTNPVDGPAQNHFLDFARFDGKMQSAHTSKVFTVYFHLMRRETEGPVVRQKPMVVTIIPAARFVDLLGLICWQYGEENREPPLQQSTDFYTVFMAEDNGAIDEDLPAVEMTESVSRFGGNKLAFVESEQPVARSTGEPFVVKVNIVDGGFSKVVLDRPDVSLRTVLEKVLKKRKMVRSVRGLEYTLEKFKEPGVAVDLEQTVDAAKTSEFWLVRSNSKNPAASTTYSWIANESPRSQSGI